MKFLRNLLEQESQVEITKRPTRQEISAVWPKGVMYRGNSVFSIVYDNLMDRLERELKRANRNSARFDSQESYLGYSPKHDIFIMGWDTWSENENEEMASKTTNTLAFRVDQTGNLVDVRSVDTQGSMMYGSDGSLEDLHHMYPDLIDIRLD